MRSHNRTTPISMDLASVAWPGRSRINSVLPPPISNASRSVTPGGQAGTDTKHGSAGFLLAGNDLNLEPGFPLDQILGTHHDSRHRAPHSSPRPLPRQHDNHRSLGAIPSVSPPPAAMASGRSTRGPDPPLDRAGECVGQIGALSTLRSEVSSAMSKRQVSVPISIPAKIRVESSRLAGSSTESH
jgi:hypothetical protein